MVREYLGKNFFNSASVRRCSHIFHALQILSCQGFPIFEGLFSSGFPSDRPEKHRLIFKTLQREWNVYFATPGVSFSHSQLALKLLNETDVLQVVPNAIQRK